MFLVCNCLADREQFRVFLFLVCIFFADREHLGAYAGAQDGNCRVVGKLMWRKCMLKSNLCSSQVIDRQEISGKRIGKIRRFSFQDSGGNQRVKCCRASEFCGTAACRMARQAATVRALWGAQCEGPPRARLLLAAAKGRRKGKIEPKPLRKPKPAHPCARKRSGWACETLLGFVDNQFD